MRYQSKYFKSSEFDSPDSPGSGEKVNDALIEKLDDIRRFVGKPLIINSGYRTPEHNAKVGGKPYSAHVLGLAVDISCTDSHDRYMIVKAAYELDIPRIEPKPTWVHLDIDPSKPQQVMFFE